MGEGKYEEIKSKMQVISKDIDKHLPEGFGFFVLVFPFGTGEGGTNYASNGQREQVIKLMKEFIIKCGHGEDWMKHLNY